MKITVITACFNSRATVGDALASVRSQRLPPEVSLEHVVVDGGSTDGTAALVAEAAPAAEAGSRFAYVWSSEPDRGLYDALNKGILRATGDVVGILNADDVFADDDVVARVAAGFTEAVDAVYADIRFVRDAQGVGAMRAAPTVRYCTGRFFRSWQFRFATFPAHPSTFVRRACFEKYGLYSLDYRICADFEMMLRLFYVNAIRARYLPFCTTVMRSGGASTHGFRANVEINREDLRALRANGVWSCLPLVYLKYLAKIWGVVLPRCR